MPRHLLRAVDLARENPYYAKWKHAGILVKGGSVLSVGFSRLLSDPSQTEMETFYPRPNVSRHAEVDALRDCQRAAGSILYIARVGRNGLTGTSRPCPDCQKEISAAGVKRVIYTISPIEYGVWYPQRKL